MTNLGFSSRSEPHNVPWRRANMSPPPVKALNNCKMHHKTAELIQSDPPCARKAKPSGEGKWEWKDAILSLRVPMMGTGWCELLVGRQRPSQLLRQSNIGSWSASRDSPTHSQRRGRVCQSRSDGGGSHPDLDFSSSTHQTQRDWPNEVQ